MQQHFRPHDCLVTGTDTEIGKTLIAATLLHWLGRQGLRTIGMKPIAAGLSLVQGREVQEDVEMLQAASTESAPLEWRTPYLLRTPASPHIAARLDGVEIDLPTILQNYRQLTQHADAVVVEGVGGFRVPLADGLDTAAMAVAFNLPVIMVVGLRLGCLNQALLTQEAILSRGLRLVGWVANSTQADMPFEADNIDTLIRLIQAPCLGHVPRLTQAIPEQACGHLSDALLRQVLSQSV
jgi:dethiobiotin synthetase